jgi:glycerophosphoryl diester phosphodiesterase
MQAWNIAHRGGAQLRPENTLPAFADCLARGCDGAELDVQLTHDGVAVVHHDARLMADVAFKDGVWLKKPGPRLKDLSLEELRQFDVGSSRPASDYALGHPLLKPLKAVVPTLEEVVRLAAGAERRFLLFVELKCGSADGAEPDVLADAAFEVIKAEAFLDNVVFVGFDWRALARIRQRAPTAQCWFTTDKLESKAHAAIDIIAGAGGQGWFANLADAEPANIAYARSCGLKIGAWTVNRQDDMRRLMELNAICTDRPDLLAALD